MPVRLPAGVLRHTTKTTTTRCLSTPRHSADRRPFALAGAARAHPSCSGTRSLSTTPPQAPSGRWIEDLRARIGKCVTFGCDGEQLARTAPLLAAIAGEWRDLLAASQGFLTPGILSAEEVLEAEGDAWVGGAGDTAAATGGSGSDGSRGGKRMGLLNHAVTWGDMDSFGHVNNTVYNKWAESARVNWLRHFAALDPAHADEWRQLMTMKHVGVILQSITTKYKMPIVYPDTISVYYRLTTPFPEPTPYLKLQSLILSHRHRRVAATTDEVVVVYDYRAARKTDLPTFATPLLDRTWRLQQVAARKAAGRIAELERGVRELERATWDRDGAVEDMGGPGGDRK
ncbi:hypothetical protein Micbo1qcDRAFT_232373 [Microdochium bolleyi]|uniref:HotDog domain-containing protein n=1 Tax=Microdochium bolleyi TaxID=196109 RepID=A0A136J663_9PEZI|nr:hypothetical protein Micbo1qcDRAFT_232373 [Microdochium bolleyi]